MMDNQHRMIAGYRELSQEDIDTMNEIKAKGAELIALLDDLAEGIKDNYSGLQHKRHDAIGTDEAEDARKAMVAMERADPWKWLAMAKTDAQTAIMYAVRAIAQPAGGV